MSLGQVGAVTINNFRCHQKLELKLTHGITLLSGPSGAGKTTVLEAIQWCLYGNVRRISPMGSKVRTSVLIDMRQFKVYRQNNPGLLQVSINSTTYEGQVAQSIVDRSYGTKKSWESCSYIKQGSRCLLMTESNANKMSLLLSLTFTEDPKQYIERIVATIKQLKERLTILQETARGKQELLAYLQQDCPDSTPLAMNVQDMTTELAALAFSVQGLTEKVKLQERVDIAAEGLRKRLIELTNAPESKVDVNAMRAEIAKNKERKDNLLDTVTNARLRMGDLDTIEKIEEELLEYSDVTPVKHTRNEIQSVWRQEEAYHRATLICQEIGIACDEDTISKKMESITEEIVESEKLLVWVDKNEQLLRLNSELKSIGEFNVVTEEEVSTQEQKVRSVIQAQDVITCPSCGEGLRYNNGRLEKSDVPVQGGLEEAQNTLTSMKTNLRKTMDHAAITNQINLIGDIPPVPSRKSIEQSIRTLKKSLVSLNSVLPQRPGKSSDTMSKENKAYELTERLSKWGEKPQRVSEGRITEMDNEMERLDKQYHIDLEIMLKAKAMQEEILTKKKLLSEMPITPSVREELKASTERMVHLKSELERAAKLTRLHTAMNSQKLVIDEITGGTADLAALETILSKANKITNDMLEENCATINSTLQGVLTKVFKDPISVSLSLTKELKSGALRRQVNVSIVYKGCTYSDIRQMSGGEGDRVSLAMALALSSISNSPFIMLDEVTPSLDESVKSKCRKVLRGIPGKIVISVGHGEVEGAYDRVIRF